MKVIKKIIVKTIPKKGSIEPILEILDGKNFDMLWTNNVNFKGKN